MAFPRPTPRPRPHTAHSHPPWTVLEDSSPSSSSSSPVSGLTLSKAKHSAASVRRPLSAARKQCATNQSTLSPPNIKNRANDHIPTSNTRTKLPTKTFLSPKPTPITRRPIASTSSNTSKPSTGILSPPVTQNSRKRKAPVLSDSESDGPPPRLPTLTELIARQEMRKMMKEKGKKKQTAKKTAHGRPHKLRKITAAIALATIDIGDSDDDHDRRIVPTPIKQKEDVIDLCSDDDNAPIATSPIHSPVKPSPPKSSPIRVREENGVIVLSTDDEGDNNLSPSARRGTQEALPKLLSSPIKPQKSPSRYSSSNTQKSTYTSPKNDNFRHFSRENIVHVSPTNPDFGDLLNFDDDDPQPQPLHSPVCSPPLTSPVTSSLSSPPREKRKAEKAGKRRARRSESPSSRKRHKTPLFLPEISSSESHPPSPIPTFKPNGLLGPFKYDVAAGKSPRSKAEPAPDISMKTSRPLRSTIFGPKPPRACTPEDVQMVNLDPDIEDPPWPKRSSAFDSGPDIKVKLDVKYSDKPVPPSLLSTLWFSRVTRRVKGKEKSRFFQNSGSKVDKVAVVYRKEGNTSIPETKQTVPLVPPTSTEERSRSKAADQPENESTATLGFPEDGLERAREEGRKLLDLIRMKSQKNRGLNSGARHLANGGNSTAEPSSRSDLSLVASQAALSSIMEVPPPQREVKEMEASFVLAAKGPLDIPALRTGSLLGNDDSDVESLDESLDFVYPEEITA